MLNTVIALSTGPALHKTMEAKVRTQVAMEGFLLIDLFRMISDYQCQQRGLPKGSRWMASQTSENLQMVALSVILVGVTNDIGDVYRSGFGRMSELPVEQHFGALRIQSASAQLSSRAYWKACARHMIRTSRRHETSKTPVRSNCSPISDDAFRCCSVRALQSALELVAWCSNTCVDSLERMYREWCESGVANMDELQGHEAEEEEWEDWREEDDCEEVLADIQNEATMDVEDEANTSVPDAVTMDLRQCPDAADLKNLLQADPPSSPMKPFGICFEGTDMDVSMPKTLHQAIFADPESREKSGVNMFDRLWRLTMYVRHYQGGGDRLWVRSARNARVASAGLSWHQQLARYDQSL